jgi:hypothetical protein
MSEVPEIRFKPLEADGYPWTKFYEVHLDGKAVGFVGTKEVRVGHGRVGRNVVSYFTYPTRWFYGVDKTRMNRMENETRREAVRRLLLDELCTPFWAATDAAKAARNYRKGEEVPSS